jgi:hypothetical protein
MSVAARAQQRFKVAIDDIQIGFPTTPEPNEIIDARGRMHLLKAGCWTPVYVRIKAGPEGIARGVVKVETTDTDDLTNVYTTPLPTGGLQPDEIYTAIAYTKIGSSNGEIKVRVEADDKRAEKRETFSALDPGDGLCLTVGSRLPGLRQAVTGQPDMDKQGIPNPRIRAAYIDDVGMLPTRWYGYGSVDLVILTTGKRRFVEALVADDKNRKEALADWVRRGGRLVISGGQNLDKFRDLSQSLKIPLPLKVTEPVEMPQILGLREWLGPKVEPLTPLSFRGGAAEAATIPVAKLELKPGENVEKVAPPNVTPDSPLLIARWPHGMGQVTLIAFDLDQPSFTDWKGQKTFWTELFKKTGPHVSAAAPANYPRGRYGYETSEQSSAILTSLSKFKDVSVISFGWVALLILVYIIIVGPLDYFFLKKVVKRLELTWITFPTVVVVISVGAYFAAYALKGNDLKINKIDLIDIDLPNQRAYGTTWFTVFSPRIQLYTVGVEPVAPNWSANPGGNNPASSVVVSWLGAPGYAFSSYDRPHSASLFRRTYEYDADAAGLTGVPIQVWSTKSFTATWERPTGLKNQSKLRRQHDTSKIEGTLTNPLPVDMEDTFLVYPEANALKVQYVGPLVANQQKQLISQGDKIQPISGWLTEHTPSPPFEALKPIMYYIPNAGPSAGGGMESRRDRSVNYLDQNWRGVLKNQAMLVGRLARMEGAGETITQDPKTPSRLWLGQLPSAGGQRPSLNGTLVQDTCVRMFIPVEPLP